MKAAPSRSDTSGSTVPVSMLPATSARVLSATALFGAARSLVIEHAGERYVLSVTRNGKLILTK